ncbi:hypothetical protein Y032_0003g1382 [Ancylostoma ceylanicum]|nr:hypothetical protein Y032_0003g1382 [Ancylostoma ceylanicum]
MDFRLCSVRDLFQAASKIDPLEEHPDLLNRVEQSDREELRALKDDFQCFSDEMQYKQSEYAYMLPAQRCHPSGSMVAPAA